MFKSKYLNKNKAQWFIIEFSAEVSQTNHIIYTLHSFAPVNEEVKEKMIYSWDTQLALCSQYVGILNIVMQTNWKFTNESETRLNIIPIVENALFNH